MSEGQKPQNTMFADGMATPQLVRTVSSLALLSVEEASQAEALEKDMAQRGLERPVGLEAWLLKVCMTGQYAAGVLERLGLESKALAQFYQLYTAEQLEQFESLFKKKSTEKQMKLRLEAYDQALHNPSSSDPGREVAALFCRFLGADNETGLADYCHDLCSELSRVFAQELASHSKGGA